MIFWHQYYFQEYLKYFLYHQNEYYELVEVFLETKCFDRFQDFSLYKLQGKGDILLISVMFFIMGYLGAFGGSDALIAIIPIGVLFASKLKLDPIVGLGVSLFATQIGFGTGPTKNVVTQGLMETRIYGGFITRFVIMNIFLLIGLLMLLHRRLFDPRIRINSSFADIMVLVLLLAQLTLGMLTIPVSMHHLDGHEMVKFMEWAQHIVTFRGGAYEYIADVALVFKAHITLGLFLLVIFPFTRLVHALSAPVGYVFRPYQIVRKRAT